MNSTSPNEALQAVHSFFAWLNGVSGSDRDMTLTDIAKFFTDDSPMILNGRFICRDRNGHLLHGKDLQSKMRSWRFNVPFERTVVEGNTVAGYYTVDFVGKDGSTSRVHDMCIWTVADGKISSIVENVVFESAEFKIESFT